MILYQTIAFDIPLAHINEEQIRLLHMIKEYIIKAIIGELSCTLILPNEVALELGWQKDEDLKCIISDTELVINKMIKT